MEVDDDLGGLGWHQPIEVDDALGEQGWGNNHHALEQPHPTGPAWSVDQWWGTQSLAPADERVIDVVSIMKRDPSGFRTENDRLRVLDRLLPAETAAWAPHKCLSKNAEASMVGLENRTLERCWALASQLVLEVSKWFLLTFP